MKVGIHLSSFTNNNPDTFVEDLRNVVETADKGGIHLVTVMDHYFQIPPVGDIAEPMNEAYSMLNYIAGITKNVRLSAMVTGAFYRNPGFLVKQVTTLDVMSKGRAFLGIGAGWFEREALGLGFGFPTLKTRFEILEENLQIAKQMWSDNNGPFEGKHFQLKETLCVPKPVQKPHPPIILGGGGETKTLKFVAKYANATNLFVRIGYDQVEHKINVIKKHCETFKRDFKEIMVTTNDRLSPDQTKADLLTHLKKQHELGVELAHFSVQNVYDLKLLNMLTQEIVPEISDW